MADGREPTQCDQCGQTDDHPKVHLYGGRTIHNDCTSVEEERLVRSSEDPIAVGALDACKSEGLRGPDLLSKIEELATGSKAKGTKK